MVSDLKEFLNSNLDRYLGMLESWVAINSFTTNRAGVNTLGELTALAFSDLGFEAERVPSENAAFGDHFILRCPGAGAGLPVIGLVSHLDTVFPPGEEAENGFTWRPEGDRIYGPGTVDIKGGTLMIYIVLDALRQFSPETFNAANWVVLLDASEETLSEDFGRICRHELEGARASLVFEGGFYEEGTFKLVQMRKGMAKYRIRTVGKAAHAGVAHADGVNAITQLSAVLVEVARFTDYSRGITFNVGVTQGGTVPNRVPHAAEAIGEMRAFDDAVFAEGLQKLSSLEGSENGGQVIVDVYEETSPWPRNAGTDALLARWQRTAEQIGWRVLPEARGGLSDGNHTWDIVPTLDGLGPGGGNAHCSVHAPGEGKEQEYLFLPSLLPKAVLNTLAIIDLLTG